MDFGALVIAGTAAVGLILATEKLVRLSRRVDKLAERIEQVSTTLDMAVAASVARDANLSCLIGEVSGPIDALVERNRALDEGLRQLAIDYPERPHAS